MEKAATSMMALMIRRCFGKVPSVGVATARNGVDAAHSTADW